MKAQRAVIMAAGFGKRLLPLTAVTPKPMLSLNGRRFIDTSLDALLAAGIEEIYIVRGHLAHRFDELLADYPMIRFIENPDYASANTISSVYYAREHLQNAYLLEADLIVNDPAIYESNPLASNYLGIPNYGPSDEWLMWPDEKGRIRKVAVGGQDGWRLYGVSFWSKTDGAQLAADVERLYEAGERDLYFDNVVFHRFPEHYSLRLRPCCEGAICEIDTFAEYRAAGGDCGE